MRKPFDMQISYGADRWFNEDTRVAIALEGLHEKVDTFASVGAARFFLWWIHRKIIEVHIPYTLVHKSPIRSFVQYGRTHLKYSLLFQNCSTNTHAHPYARTQNADGDFVGLGAAVPHAVDGGSLVYEATATTNTTVEGISAQESTMTTSVLSGEASVTVRQRGQHCCLLSESHVSICHLAMRLSIDIVYQHVFPAIGTSSRFG